MGGYIKEDVWGITNRIIRSIFGDYLAMTRSTVAKSSFESDYQLWSTLIWGIIKIHIATDKMLGKYITDHPIVIENYSQWLVINCRIQEAMEAKVRATKINDKVGNIFSSTASSAKRINEFKTSIAFPKEASNTSIKKLGSLVKK